jgi:hypothetical protein
MEVSMKRWLATVLVFAVSSAVVRADITIVQTTTIEGGMAAMGGANPSPRMTNRIKGLKSRNDVEMPNTNASTITDLTTKQVIMLRHDQKTAQFLAGAPSAPVTTTTAPSISVNADASVTPTGKSQVIDGIKCDEYAFTSSMSMADVTGSQMPPEAAAMMKDLTMTMNGSMWVAKDVPGIAEYVAFQKALGSSNLSSALMGATGVSIPGMDKMMKAMGSVNGMAYLTEMTMTIEGSGQMADMMKQMGAMKITTKVTSVNSDPLADDLFQVPAGYTVVKQ